MGLHGLRRRHPLCKICNAFQDDVTLNEITLDILLHRKTYAEIREHYNKLLPPSVNRINDVNINNHRKHSDPANLVMQTLAAKGEIISAGEQISDLYSKRFQDAFDKVKVLKEVYKERLANMETLQKILDAKKKALGELTFTIANFEPTADIDESKKTLADLKYEEGILQATIRKLTLEIDSIHNDIQNVVIKEINSDKGLAEGSIQITQNITVVVQSRLQGFMEEIIPYLLTEVFSKDQDLGKAVVSRLANTMDKHILPIFEEQELLLQSAKALPTSGANN